MVEYVGTEGITVGCALADRARAAMSRGHYETARQTFELAHRAFLESGDRTNAANSEREAREAAEAVIGGYMAHQRPAPAEPAFTVQAGRLVCLRGVPLFHVIGVKGGEDGAPRGLSPIGLGDITHKIVDLLNAAEG